LSPALIEEGAAAELEAASLSSEDKAFVKQFAEEGYVIFNPQADDSVIDQLVAEMAPRFAEAEGNRIIDAWKFNEKVRYMATLSSVQDKLRLLYRREPIPFQTLNFPVGTQQHTHSDMIHFSSIPQRFMCGVWIAFEDITNENGPLHYYPQGHKLPFYDMLDMGVKGSDNRQFKRRTMKYAENYEVFIQELVQVLAKLQLQFSTVKMLSKASHLFPGQFVKKMKTILLR
jgi:ectoine hydroxylase-related dioxygenase (phytanoyl-CoA dioxygenase family)